MIIDFEGQKLKRGEAFNINVINSPNALAEEVTALLEAAVGMLAYGGEVAKDEAIKAVIDCLKKELIDYHIEEQKHEKD